MTVHTTPLSLLQRVQNPGDQASWQRLVDTYTPFIRRILLARGIPVQDVDDLVQEVLSVVVKEITQFSHNGRSGAFRLWIRNILTNRLRRYREINARNAVGVVATETLENIEDPCSDLCRMWDEEHDHWITRRTLELIRSEFSVSTWEAFSQQIVFGQSAAQTAELLGISINAALISKSRVLRRLRAEVAELTEESGLPRRENEA